LVDLAVLGRATRAKTLPVMLSPVVVGAALAWQRGAAYAWGWFGVTLAGAAAFHLAANVVNDYFDARSGVDKLARIDRTAIATGSGLIESGQVSARGMLGLAALLAAAALATGAVIAVARGVAVLAIGSTGAVLAWQYFAPPLRYGYRGKGLGELGIFVGFGVLPVVGSYYVQTGRIDAVAVWAGIVPGMLTTLVVFHHNFLHWRADKAVRKMTPVAVLGPEKALLISAGAIVAVYVALTLEVAFGIFPMYGLLALVTALPLGGSWSRAFRDPTLQRSLNLLGATLGTSFLVGVVLTLALIAAR